MNHVITNEQAAALRLRLTQGFTFDLIDHVEDMPDTPLRNDVLATLAFSADGYINAKLSGLLNKFYQEERAGEQVNFSTYTEFLDYIRGVDFGDYMRNDQGFDVTPTRQTLQALVDIRQALHAVIAKTRPTYVIPEITDMLRNPRVRTASADTLLKMEDLAKEIAEGDAAFEAELRAQFARKHRGQALQRNEWDKQRGVVTAMLFDAFNLTLDAGDEEPYLKLDAQTQYGMLRSAAKAIDRSIERAMDDSRITSIEFAKLRVEARKLKTDLDQVMAHERFSEVG